MLLQYLMFNQQIFPLQIFYITFKIQHRIACSRFIRPFIHTYFISNFIVILLIRKINLKDLESVLYRYYLILYTVMQSDRNSLKTNTFHKPTTYKRHVQTNNEQKTTFARNKFGRVGVFRIKIRSLLLKLQPLEQCQFSNCSHLIASHCTDTIIALIHHF